MQGNLHSKSANCFIALGPAWIVQLVRFQLGRTNCTFIQCLMLGQQNYIIGVEIGMIELLLSWINQAYFWILFSQTHQHYNYLQRIWKQNLFIKVI
jgi:hypothetical protein